MCPLYISMLRMKIFTQAVDITHFILIPANKESDQNMKLEGFTVPNGNA